MKKILKAIGNMFAGLGIVIGISAGIALSAWFLWQVMPDNPYHDQWTWNLPPFPFPGIWVLLSGFAPMTLILPVGYLAVQLIKGLIEKIRKKPEPEVAEATDP